MIPSAGPPFLPLPGHCEKFPHCLSRHGDIKIPGHIGLGTSYLNARALVLLLPRVLIWAAQLRAKGKAGVYLAIKRAPQRSDRSQFFATMRLRRRCDGPRGGAPDT
jgi:hypothetical protein